MAASKTSCATCNKGTGQFKCEGCSQAFCTKHVAEHRQMLSQQLDEVALEHDLLQQTTMVDQNPSNELMIAIAQWEEKSIEKIRQTARDVRERVSEVEKKQNRRIMEELRQLKEQIRKAREDDDFFENDLRNWLEKLKKLEEVKNTVLASHIREDQASPLVHQIQIFSASSDSTPNSMNSIHPRLQYTNQDGVYVNPSSSLVTAIWYFYSPTYNSWFWTPYKTYEVWMPVDNPTVKSGFYRDQQPGTINLVIIEYLRQNSPVPPNSIYLEAVKAENRILKL